MRHKRHKRHKRTYVRARFGKRFANCGATERDRSLPEWPISRYLLARFGRQCCDQTRPKWERAPRGGDLGRLCRFGRTLPPPSESPRRRPARAYVSDQQSPAELLQLAVARPQPSLSWPCFLLSSLLDVLEPSVTLLLNRGEPCLGRRSGPARPRQLSRAISVGDCPTPDGVYLGAPRRTTQTPSRP